MTEAEYVQRVRELGLQHGLTLDPGDIRDGLDTALGLVSAKIAQESDYPLQQNVWTFTMTGGEVSLGATDDIMIETIDTVLHPDIDGLGTQQYLSRIPNGTRADLAHYTNRMFPPYIIEDNTIVASLGLGAYPDVSDIPPNNNAVKVTANQVATIANLAVQYEPDLILAGLMLATQAPAEILVAETLSE